MPLLRIKARVHRWARILRGSRPSNATFPVYLDYPERDSKGSTKETRPHKVGCDDTCTYPYCVCYYYVPAGGALWRRD